MKKYRYSLGFFCFFYLSVLIGKAQVETLRYDALDFGAEGVVYYLPKTEIVVELLIEEEVYIPGDLAPYSLRYIGSTVGQEEKHNFVISSAHILSKGTPDQENQYVVSFEGDNSYSYVSLSKEGVIAAINTSYHNSKNKLEEKENAHQVNDRAISIAFPQEYVLATSKAKRAEIAATMLFDFRSSLVDLLSGRSENAPRDGEAFQIAVSGIKAQISALETLFLGKKIKKEHRFRCKVDPSQEIKNHPVIRFKKNRGILPINSLEGDLLTLDMEAVRVMPQLSPKEQEKRDKKLKGIIYNLPGLASFKLKKGGELICQKDLPVTQMGTRISLAPRVERLKGEKIEVLFDIDTGTIKEIRKNNLK